MHKVWKSECDSSDKKMNNISFCHKQIHICKDFSICCVHRQVQEIRHIIIIEKNQTVEMALVKTKVFSVLYCEASGKRIVMI